MSDQLTFREYRPEDLPGVLKLWEQESDWGALTEEQFRQWYMETPVGQCLVTVAIDGDGEIVGQEVFTPARVVVEGREVRGLHLAAPIVSGRLRAGALTNPNHPVIGLFKAAAALGVARGFHLVYALPKRGWLHFFRLGRRFGMPSLPTLELPCVGRSVEPQRSELVDGVRVIERQEFGTEFEELWARARSQLPIVCGVVRNRAWLEHQNGEHTRFFEVRRDGADELVGYVSIRHQVSLIHDVLAATQEDLALVLRAVIDHLAVVNERGNAPIERIKAMKCGPLAVALDAAGFEPEDFQFGFSCYPMRPDITLEQIAPERWYITSGD